jgi:hypothetical protein
MAYYYKGDLYPMETSRMMMMIRARSVPHMVDRESSSGLATARQPSY